MKRFLLFLTCAVMLFGVSLAQETLVYTLTPEKGTNSDYSKTGDVTVGGITWTVSGNTQMQPWRVGGKSGNTSKAVRPIYSKNVIADNVSKVEMKLGSSDKMTFNSFKFIVSKNADFSSPVYESAVKPSLSATTTYTRPEGQDWSGCYYKFEFNITATNASSNGYIEFSEAKFYKSSDTGTVTPEPDPEDPEEPEEPTIGHGVSFEINNTNLGNNATAYVSTAFDFTFDGVTFNTNNINPSSGQVRGNKENTGEENFYIFNKTAIPNIEKIILTYSSEANTIGSDNIFLTTGTAVQSTKTSTGTKGNLSGTVLTFTFTDNNPYFRIQFTKGATSGTCKLSKVEIITKQADDPEKTTPEISWSSSEVSGTWSNLDAISWPTLEGAEGLDVTYTSSEAKVATVATDGTVTVLIPGTTTIKAETAATDKLNSASASYTLTVALDGTLTVAEALKLIKAGCTETAVVAGVITAVDEVNTQYGNATFDIKDADADASAETLKVFRTKNIGNVNFTADDKVEVGATVTAKGALLYYNNDTPELSSGELLSYDAPETEEPEQPEAKEYTALNQYNDQTYTLEVGKTMQLELGEEHPQISYDIDPAEAITIDENGKITANEVAEGVVVMAEWEGNETWTEGGVMFTINVTAAQGGETPEPTEGAKWVKVTSSSELTLDGEYLMVSTTNYPMLAKGTSYLESGSQITVTDNTIVPTADNSNFGVVTFEGTELTSVKVKITSLEGTVLGYYNATADKKMDLKANASQAIAASVSYQTNGTVKIEYKSGNTSWGYIQYNASNPRFLNYSSSQIGINLYKKVEDTQDPEQPEAKEYTALEQYNDQTYTLEVGKTMQLELGEEHPEISYDIDPSEAITIDENGKITANEVAEGVVVMAEWVGNETWTEGGVMFTINVTAAQGGETPEPKEGSFQITFKNQADGTSDSNKEYDKPAVTDVIVEGAEYVEAITETTKAYSGKVDYGLKLGTGSVPGSITLQMSEAGKVNATKIVVNAAAYNASNAIDLTLNEVKYPEKVKSTDFSDFEFTLTGNDLLEEIALSTSKYAYIKGLTVYYAETEVEEPTVPGEVVASVSPDAFVAANTEVTFSAEGATSFTITTYAIDGTSTSQTVSPEEAKVIVTRMSRRFDVVANNEVGPTDPREFFYNIGKEEVSDVPGAFIKVNTPDEIKDGDKIIIGSTADKKTITYMSTTASKGMGKTASATYAEVVEKPVDNTMIIDVVAVQNGYKLQYGEKYLTIGSSALSLDATGSVFTIGTYTTGEIQLKSGDYMIEFNSGVEDAFRGYKGTMAKVTVFRQETSTQTVMVQDDYYVLAMHYTEQELPKAGEGENLRSLALSGVSHPMTTDGGEVYTIDATNLMGKFSFSIDGEHELTGSIEQATNTEGEPYVYIRDERFSQTGISLIVANDENSAALTTHPDEANGQVEHHGNTTMTITLDPFRSISLAATPNQTPTGVDNITVDGVDGSAEYYNLQGVRLDGRTLVPGTVVIRRQGTEVSKMVVR